MTGRGHPGDEILIFVCRCGWPATDRIRDGQRITVTRAREKRRHRNSDRLLTSTGVAIGRCSARSRKLRARASSFVAVTARIAMLTMLINVISFRSQTDSRTAAADIPCHILSSCHTTMTVTGSRPAVDPTRLISAPPSPQRLSRSARHPVRLPLWWTPPAVSPPDAVSALPGRRRNQNLPTPQLQFRLPS